MPFKVHIFQENLERWLKGSTQGKLVQACQTYTAQTSPAQKTKSIREMMIILDEEVDEAARRSTMMACGRRCIGDSTLAKARRMQQETQNLDDLLERLNESHIGGGHLWREDDVIHASYDKCYCGSVSKTRQPFSATYCQCSCGWYQQLFETLLEKPVEVELLGSIIQGDERCQFLIHLPESV